MSPSRTAPALFALALFGLGLSAFLAWHYLFDLPVPCTDAGCDTARAWHDAHFPRGFLPLLGVLYFAVLAASIFRRRPDKFLLLASGLGALVAFSLQLVAYTILHAFCLWCLLIALTTILCFILAALAFPSAKPAATPSPRAFLTAAALSLLLLLLLILRVTALTPTAAPSAFLALSAADAARLVRPDSPSLGPADAKVTLVEFADPSCAACAAEAPILDAFLQRHPADVRLVYRHFPLLAHPTSALAVEALAAAQAQGKFWPLRDLLFANLDQQSPADLDKYAALLGLDLPTFDHALQTHQYAPLANRDRADAQALGVHLTPTIFINTTQRLNGPATPAALESAYQHALTPP